MPSVLNDNMGKPFIDLTNQTFNHWTVTGPHKSVPRPDGHGNRTHWFCTCQCGNTAWVDATNLRQNISRNCGCLRKVVAGKGSPAAIAAAKANTTHGMSKTPLYHCYHGMISRCYLSTNREYAYYGGRGITVCDRWRHSFANFVVDMGSSFSPGLSIERVDVNGPYSPDNCIWLPRKAQPRNTTKSVRVPSGALLKDFCREHNLDYQSLYYLIVKKGIPFIEAMKIYRERHIDL
jgi:hypothetical protein